MSTLVLKRFTVDSSPDADLTVDVCGRVPGLLSWFLTLIGIDPVTTLRCYRDRIEYSTASWGGQRSMTIPSQSVTSIVGGHAKPTKLLIAAVIFFVVGCVGWIQLSSNLVAILGIVVSLICVVTYILRKEMELYVQNGGSDLLGFTFNRSVIENIPVDIDRVNEAVQMINRTVLMAKRG